MPIEFSIKVIKTDEGDVLATRYELKGFVDASTVEEFEQVMGKLILGGAKNMILDCTKLEYINSTGLGLFLRYADELAETEGRFCLIHVPSATQKVIEMMGFQYQIKVLADDEAALKWL